MEQCVGAAKGCDIQKGGGTCPGSAHGGDVRKLHGCRCVLLWIEELGEPIEARVGDPRHAYVRVRLSTRSRHVTRVRQQLKERCLPGRGKSNETCSEHPF